MKLIHFLIFVGLYILFPITLRAQQTEGEQVVKKVMQNIRLHKMEAINTNLIYKAESLGKVLGVLSGFYRDTMPEIRAEALRISGLLGKRSADKIPRKRIVNALLEGCRDSDGLVCHTSLLALKDFRKDDFDVEAVKKMALLLAPETHSLEDVIMLAGFINSKQYESPLQALYDSDRVSKKAKKSALLALSRIGNTSALDQVMRNVRGQMINDPFIYEAGPALVYIRKRESINYLFEVIKSDEKNCESANPDSNENILCAYRAMEFVAPVVKGFPVSTDASGDLNVKDYATALALVRSWLEKNKSIYELNEEVY